jgi:quercetin dioxygenase-like cupin family protein
MLSQSFYDGLQSVMGHLHTLRHSFVLVVLFRGQNGLAVVTKELGHEYPGVVSFARLIFQAFDEHELVVRAVLSSPAGMEVRDRGGVEGRSAFAHSLSGLLAEFGATERARAVAVFVAIYSAPFWQLLRDRGGLTGPEAQEAAAWLIELLLDSLRRTRKKKDMKEPSGKNDRIEILGIELQWKLRRNDTIDQYCVLAATMPPGVGVPVHQHPQQEAFFILEGQAEFALENGAGLAWKEVNPGQMVNIPPDAIHGFRNASDRDVKLLLTCEAGLGRFFEEAGTPLTENQSARANVSPEEIQRVLQIAKKHGQRFPAPA